MIEQMTNTVSTFTPALSLSGETSFYGKNFLNAADFTPEAFRELVERALSLKNEGYDKQLLRGVVVGMMFFNPSLRTKASLSSGVARLGGTTIDLGAGSGAYNFEFNDGVTMDGVTQEHIKEAAPVIAQYCDAIAVRCSELITKGNQAAETSTYADSKADTVIHSFAKYAGVPVINLESNIYHPCQGLGDALTLRELFGSQIDAPRRKKYVLTWAYHPKPLPTATPNSQLQAACDMGYDVVLAYPEGWDLDPEIVATAAQRAQSSGGTFAVSHNMAEAAQDADVICAKSWGAIQYYSDWEQEKALRSNLKHWIVDANLMSLTNNAHFMHCLPTRRNVEVSDSVLDSPNSVVIQEAGNRMYAQNALVASLLGKWR